MTQEKNDGHKDFTQCPNSIIDGYPELAIYDKWVLLTLMRVCWKRGPHKISLREISSLSGVPSSLLCSTSPDAKKPKEGILDRLGRLGLLKVESCRPINSVTGAKGRTQTYIYIEHEKIWDSNTEFFATNDSIKQDMYLAKGEFETVRLTNSNSPNEVPKIVRQENNNDRQVSNDVRQTNSNERQTNNDVHPASSNVTPNTSNITNTLEDKEDMYVPNGTDPSLSLQSLLGIVEAQAQQIAELQRRGIDTPTPTTTTTVPSSHHSATGANNDPHVSTSTTNARPNSANADSVHDHRIDDNSVHPAPGTGNSADVQQEVEQTAFPIVGMATENDAGSMDASNGIEPMATRKRKSTKKTSSTDSKSSGKVIEMPVKQELTEEEKELKTRCSEIYTQITQRRGFPFNTGDEVKTERKIIRDCLAPSFTNAQIDAVHKYLAEEDKYWSQLENRVRISAGLIWKEANKVAQILKERRIQGQKQDQGQDQKVTVGNAYLRPFNQNPRTRKMLDSSRTTLTALGAN